MSADNGFVIRKNASGQFVLQMYFASADDYPPIEENLGVFDTLFDARSWYDKQDFDSEYGLRIQTVPMTVESYEDFTDKSAFMALNVAMDALAKEKKRHINALKKLVKLENDQHTRQMLQIQKLIRQIEEQLL